MKLPLIRDPRRPLDSRMAKAAFLVNQFATPGLGSLMARKWLAGTGQIALACAGFLMLIVWYFEWLLSKFSDLPDATVKQSNIMGQLGAIIFLVSWLWSLVTSIQLLREARRNSLSPPGQTDPGARQN